MSSRPNVFDVERNYLITKPVGVMWLHLTGTSFAIICDLDSYLLKPFSAPPPPPPPLLSTTGIRWQVIQCVWDDLTPGSGTIYSKESSFISSMSNISPQIQYHCVYRPACYHMNQVAYLWDHSWQSYLICLCYVFCTWPALQIVQAS